MNRDTTTMNRDEAKIILPFVTALAEGRQVQTLDFNEGDWTDIDEITVDYFLSHPLEYRIKPEPKYRPFKDGAECWEEMQKHDPFGWIKAIPNEKYIAKYYPCSKDNNPLYYQVQKVAPAYIKYDDINDVYEIGEQDKSYKDVFGVMTFADGTPFGIKEA